MPAAPLSSKQLEVLGGCTSRINILCGAVRSGKTYIAIMKLIQLLQEGPEGHVMLVGATRESLQRNIINDLCDLLGAGQVSSKSNEIQLFGRRIYLLGANDESAVRRIQGSTLAIALCDEIAVLPEPFVKMLLSRLSKPGAILLATSNPEGPHHWLKTDFIDRVDDLSLTYYQFQLDDNPALDEDYKKALKSEYSGHWYARYILGEWAVAEGLVYAGLDDENWYEHDIQNPAYYIAGVDYGITNPTAAVIIGVQPRQWPQLCLSHEYYYDSKANARPKTDAELADDLAEFFVQAPPRAIYIDPSAASLKLELRRRELPVVDAKNDVIEGIQTVAKFINQRNLIINKNCSNIKKELLTYSWDAKAADRGVDKPVKTNDHICFVAGTMVATPQGNVPIETLRVGDLVMTRDGPQPIEFTGSHSSDDIWELDVQGTKVVGTGNHPMWTRKGHVCISSMSGCFEVSRLEEVKCTQKRSIGMASLTDGIRKANTRLTRSIFARTFMQLRKAAATCIETCTDFIKGIFHRATTSIIKMATLEITTYQTLSASAPNSTSYATQTHGADRKSALSTCKGSGHSQENGTKAKRVGSGIRSIGKTVSQRLSSLKNRLVKFARSRIFAESHREAGSVATSAGQHGEGAAEWTTRIESAQCVAKPLRPTSTASSNAALDSARPSSVVYNIKVSGPAEYYANGILCSNCDALRYCLASAFPSKEVWSPNEDLTVEQWKQQAQGHSPLDGLFNTTQMGYR